MTNIGFYILSQDSAMARLHYTCRMVEKALLKGHRIALAVSDESAALELSNYLCQFKPESFIPHQIQGEATAAPVYLCWDQDDESHHDMLINLRSDIPLWFSRFQRVMEIVVQEENCLKETREHYQYYKNRGYPMKTHKIAS